jgi:predicted acylesterase/phospholipase RssA
MKLLLFCLLSAANNQPPSATPDIRVGVVAYQDVDLGMHDFERLFDELAAASHHNVRFQLALGTYGDVIYWLDKQLIDVAVLTPGAFVQAQRIERDAKPICQYLATRLLSPLDDGGTTALPAKSKGPRDRYRAVCIVADHSGLRTMSDVRRAWEADRLRFVFVDALSASGHLAPTFALNQAGIGPAPKEIEYSYSHTNSLRLVGAADDGMERIAFVWDGALGAAIDVPPVRNIQFAELDALSVPADVVVARSDFDQTDRLVELLTSRVDAAGEHEFAVFADWTERYREVSRWASELHQPLDSDEVQAVSLDGLSQMLRHYAHTRPRGHSPRLALVLSGGGAKCAYQIGAVTALEERLAQLRAEPGGEGLAISLVAGTSGGAINALAIALGTSQSPEGRAELRRAWQSLDQREIVRPSRLVRGNMGLWFVGINVALVLFVARKLVRSPARRAWTVIALLFVLAALHIALSYLPFKPWRTLGSWHGLHHAWLWGTFGIESAGWCLLAVALAAAIWQRKLTRAGKTLTLPAWATTWGLTIALLGLPLLQIITIFLHEKTLSDGQGIERRLLESFTELAQFRAQQLGGQPLDVDRLATTAEKMKSLSRQILGQKLLARDLVVTGSCLERSTEDLPSDLYFFAPCSSQSLAVEYGARGISLAERPELLLDVVTGSGSIFSVFPPRTLHDFPRPGESVDLVDGGFAHNSPIEAAVRWGATHIILIEADPQQRHERRNFLQNAAGAFNHLYYQAQLVDARSREKEQVVVFTLRPKPPHLCVLDFADNLIDSAIDKGYREARGESVSGGAGTSGRRRFRKELGEPWFHQPTQSDD